MRKSTYYIELDIERREAQGCMSVRQGESGRRLVIALMSGGHPYDPGEGCYAVLAGTKPDGTPDYQWGDFVTREQLAAILWRLMGGK